MDLSPAERLNEMAHGYQHSVVLLTANKVGVFQALGEATRTCAELAGELDLDARALEVLLLALVAEGLLDKSDGGFRVREEYAPFLLPESPRTQASIFNHGHNIMQSWVRLEETLHTGRPVERERERDEQSLRDFICGMANISWASSAEVAAKLDLSPYRRMLDLGGGPGAASIVFTRENPDMHAVVFDLPGPCAIAREQIAKAGLDDRVDTESGDFLKDDLGSGFDLVYISNVIHSLSPDETRSVLAKCLEALEPGGSIVVKDFFLDADRATPAFAALFSINMLVNTEGGKSYTWDETEAMLCGLGFTDFRRISVATASALLLAVKPD